MAASVEVRIELGHRAKIRDVPTENGHTHDWMVYVKGYEGISLGYFVEKVVFHLHDTYDPSKRVLKQPPYRVEESGFAGFIMPIDVYFRNREEPKTVTFNYDLFLHVESMPPVNHTRLEKLTFTNPTEDFRKKLLDAGALLIRPMDQLSSKERSRDSPSSHLKKDRSKSKEHSKRREGSSHTDDRKKSMSSKKEGRIAAKDIKRHEDDFKHPKMPDLTKSRKEGDSTQRERGRSDKKRPAADIDGSKKKKKKHSSSSPHPQESRPKSLNIPVPTSTTKKEKIRKIKEKPDLMAGLFAPENSINMSHIKQSREKMKAESSGEPKSKKEKRTAVVTPTGSSDSPRLDDHTRANSSKISTSGSLTLKIKKEKLSPNVEKDPKKEIQSMKRQEKIKTEKRDESSTKHKKRIKENPDVAKVKYEDLPKRKSPIISSSSSSGSDMEISSNSDSSPERQLKPPSKPLKSDKKSHKTSKSHKESKATLDKSEKKSSSQGISKSDKIKASHTREASPNMSKTKDRTKVSQSPRPQGSSKSSKKPDKKESKPTDSREKDMSIQISRKSKKDKRSSHEKESKTHKDSKRSKTRIKEEKSESVHIPVKTKTDDTKSPKPPKSMPIVASVKPNKSSRSPSQHRRGKHAHKRPDKKLSKSSENIVMKPYLIAKSEIKSEIPSKRRKERPFSETGSSDDDDLSSHFFATTIPPHHSPIDREPSHRERSRNDSVSSSSSNSAASSVSENRSSHSSSSSSSGDSSNEEELQKIQETAAITERALSPIDSAYNLYQNAKVSYSGDSSSPVRENFSQPSQADSVTDNPVHDETSAHESPMHDMDVCNRDLCTTSDEDEEFASQAPEKPFQDHEHAAFEDEPPPEEPPNIIVGTGSPGTYPHMTQELYLDLQDLQKKLSYVTDVDRLSKIANIVHKSQKLLHRDDYFDFDLCALDERTIRKIKKELKAA